MISQNGNRWQEIVQNIRPYAKGKVSETQIPLMEAFAPRYFAAVPTADLEERPLADLLGLFCSHWSFLYQRHPNESKVRVFNPTKEKDGWDSIHTVIQVSHDDIPFLVDSIRTEVNRNDLQIHFAIHFGGLKVIRNEKGKIQKILSVGEMASGYSTEAPLYFEIDRLSDAEAIVALQENIQRILYDVRISVADWKPMLERAEQSLIELEVNPPPFDLLEVSESKDFLKWLINNNFTFLGSRDYKLIGDANNRALQIVPGSGLGVLRDDAESAVSRTYAELPPEARKLALSKNILVIAQTNTKATVHRPSYTYYIGVKRFNDKGELIGERRFIGLYTSTAYHTSPRSIPFLRHKVAKIMQELRFPPDSHSGKEVVHILETLPRDDLFQASHEELLNLTISILQLQERQQVRLFIRKDAYNRFFSCLVYVPRDIFTTELCLSVQDVLMHELRGEESTFTTYFSDSILARMHFVIRVDPKNSVDYQVNLIEKKVVAVSRSWLDDLKDILIYSYGEGEGLKYFRKYARAFPASYVESYSVNAALADIKKIESIKKPDQLEMLFYAASNNSLRLKLFHNEQTIALSDILPTLENMGMHVIGEIPHQIILKDDSNWINDFDMTLEKNESIDIALIRDNFQAALKQVWAGEAEDDGLNKLVVSANLAWHQVAVLRAYVKYLRQIGFTFSQKYIENTLGNHPGIAKNLFELFEMRFSTEYTDEKRPQSEDLIAEIETQLDKVTSLDEDRILRRLLELIQATIRTNYFQKTPDGNQKSYISFKFNPALIKDLPLPRPLYEIFVYAPRVEGVHLRGGKVARGGIRWSDRREDFRTEILGLMKAQQVKNSVIVPVGAKGGFYPKSLPKTGDRDALIKEVIESYSTFMRGLLDITDNIQEGQVVPPRDVIRYDEDDPYLVVAADKGTATFSDIANAISAEYGFWLDDAFASGGSAGYDHKKMGITARGAWESVKRHFRELDRDPEKEPFTVIGIGDMAGDVFGNGMLMSKNIKLVGAFNHLHIFLDPNPNPLVSFEERKRLFNLPRSNWSDYNAKIISEGGGVFERSAKSIKLSPEIKAVLNITEDQMVPNDLIRAMLCAPVDLLWNGGIGTFVKASFESQSDAGDRTNDAIRIDGNEINAKMVGEGGNLGLTQNGRVEYSLNGGILFTDFIDNSAGVDCSDHEVNIKILLNKLVADGEMTLAQRNTLLESMTDEVAHLVLRDNYEQTQLVSLEYSVSNFTVDVFSRYINSLVKLGRLNRKLEFLPDEKQIQERKSKGIGFTRPELSVLVAYCKMYLKQDILASDVIDDSYFERHLKMAFPKVLGEKYLPQMHEHSLRREIIATQLGKYITDHMGINFIDKLQHETGASMAFIIRAFVIAESVYDMHAIWDNIELLDFKVDIDIQHRMMMQIYYLIRRATRWFLRNRKPTIDISQTIAEFKEPIQDLIRQLPGLMTEMDLEAVRSDRDIYIRKGVPEEFARLIASCNFLFTSLDIVEASKSYHLPLADVANAYYTLGNYLELNWLREQMENYPMDNYWDELARSGFRDDLDRAQRKLSINVILSKSKKTNDKTIKERISDWMERNKRSLTRWNELISEIRTSQDIGFITFSVVLRELYNFSEVELQDVEVI